MKSAKEIKIVEELQSSLPAPGADGKFIALKELNDAGFPDFMVLAFLNTAKATKTIVSSRLPGGVGTELIEAGYDLKGFQIKAKSCDWGPMGGFICQLPFLNKEGFSKVAFNANEIINYLKPLKAFEVSAARIKKVQDAIDELRDLLSINKPLIPDSVRSVLNKLETIREKCKKQLEENKLKKEDYDEIVLFITKDEVDKEFRKQQDEITNAGQSDTGVSMNPMQERANLNMLSPSFRTFVSIKKKILRIYENKIATIIKEYKNTENSIKKAGEKAWSGENTIPNGPLPFLRLQRTYKEGEVFEKIKKMKGVDKATVSQVEPSGNGLKSLTGIAYNKAAIEEATIKIEFLLQKQKDSDRWNIYHGDISYRQDTGHTFEVYNFIPDSAAKDIVLEKLGIKPVQEGNVTKFAEATKKFESGLEYLKYVLSRQETDTVMHLQKTYYPLRGIMNPHPPYPSKRTENNVLVDNPEFYKNAVSGDFDLFAFWPDASLPEVELDLVRLSEIRLNQNLKLQMNASQLFGLEFIPGFGELEKGGIKESAELGNINTLGYMVSSLLNSFAETSYKDIYGGNAQGNKAFHSDEGGRPGILEVEFPIAVFFPEKIKSKALNNLGEAPTAVFKRKRYISTAGGLIKNIEEFVQLLLDINFTRKENKTSVYKIMMHSEWMIHFFFMALPLNERKVFISEVQKLIDDNLKAQNSADNESVKYTKGWGNLGEKVLKDKLKEFKKIADLLISKAVNQPEFVKSLKILLRGEAEKDESKQAETPYLEMDDAVFTDLRNKFLLLAFQGDDKAILRKTELEQVLYKKDLTAQT
jgi:hypothetical protein